jgi:hypothetical protein
LRGFGAGRLRHALESEFTHERTSSIHRQAGRGRERRAAGPGVRHLGEDCVQVFEAEEDGGQMSLASTARANDVGEGGTRLRLVCLRVSPLFFSQLRIADVPGNSTPGCNVSSRFLSVRAPHPGCSLRSARISSTISGAVLCGIRSGACDRSSSPVSPRDRSPSAGSRATHYRGETVP